MPVGTPASQALRHLNQSRFHYDRLVEKHERELVAYRAKIAHLETVYADLKAAEGK